uniref:Nucleolar GTP-binding protein 1 n=1 Tax=Timspurckia oligopyrenoides TaxID=708627 RepID=A0A7S0ZE53_9RHOD|mmetsp:Transcript_1769/g.3165  ORF Transcript_1769/g.3165 Transcript_1769/m.3165 type:complete len:692 (+) Transcript_1769:79-2154(+)
MVVYNFKKIQAVPTSKDFVDIVLSKTQRKTPTVVHRGYAISRIRGFYLRKVKYTQQNFHDKLTQILTDFPRVEELHPFYADLVNVLYDRDHYKLALGQLAKARTLIDSIGKDYAKLLKYGDSLYRCKQLKRAALGRMCTLMRRHASSLEYLEQVRQHMSRLPSIDPATRTLLIAGFPNVGKSSFINKVTRAEVDVQPYAFTTKSLFVGHMDYKYLRWQVIDTPGILDHTLEERNTIEMQSITALAHLRAAILFFVDPSESCGFSLEKQLELLRGMTPLFVNKPLLLILNKTDLDWENQLSDEQKLMLAELEKSDDAQVSTEMDVADTARPNAVLKMSTFDESGIAQVRNTACDLLLEQRVESKIRSRRAQTALHRLHLAQPVSRDGKERPPVIPPSVLLQREKMEDDGLDDTELGQTTLNENTPIRMDVSSTRKLQKELMWENGGPGVYSSDWRREYSLKKPEWAYDIIPEIVDGKNIADFVDADIEQRLIELEREEEAREAAEEVEMEDEERNFGLNPEQMTQLRSIREKKAIMKTFSVRERSKANNRPIMPKSALGKRMRTEEALEEHLEDLGMDEEDAQEIAGNVSARAKKNSDSAMRKRARRAEHTAFEGEEEHDAALEEAKLANEVKAQGYSSIAEKLRARKLANKKRHKLFSRSRSKGEGDRSIPTSRPRHLLSGKRGMGKTDRR